MALHSMEFKTPPAPVGHYVIREEPYGKMIWQWSKRPSWWHRFTFRLFFGLRWVDTCPNCAMNEENRKKCICRGGDIVPLKF